MRVHDIRSIMHLQSKLRSGCCGGSEETSSNVCIGPCLRAIAVVWQRREKSRCASFDVEEKRTQQVLCVIMNNMNTNEWYMMKLIHFPFAVLFVEGTTVAVQHIA